MLSEIKSDAKRQVLNIILHIPPHMWILKKQISFIRVINRGGDGGAVGGQLKLTVIGCIFCDTKQRWRDGCCHS